MAGFLFSQWTETARRAIFYARLEASESGAGEIMSEHLLLGILRAAQGPGAHLIPSGLTADAVRKRVRAGEPFAEIVPDSVHLPLSVPVKRALAFGAAEWERLRRGRFGPEYLLLGVAGEQSCEAARILSEHGVTVERLRSEIERPN